MEIKMNQNLEKCDNVNYTQGKKYNYLVILITHAE